MHPSLGKEASMKRLLALVAVMLLVPALVFAGR